MVREKKTERTKNKNGKAKVSSPVRTAVDKSHVANAHVSGSIKSRVSRVESSTKGGSFVTHDARAQKMKAKTVPSDSYYSRDGYYLVDGSYYPLKRCKTSNGWSPAIQTVDASTTLASPFYAQNDYSEHTQSVIRNITNEEYSNGECHCVCLDVYAGGYYCCGNIGWDNINWIWVGCVIGAIVIGFIYMSYKIWTYVFLVRYTCDSKFRERNFKI